MNNYQELTTRLGYSFKTEELLDRALRHRSSGKVSNERLEFLGDSVLNFIIAAELFSRYPKTKEGELSRMRANLVNGDMLAELAIELDIGKEIQFGAGELRTGGAKRHSILADTMEAIIGAIYLDAGFEVVQKQVLIWFAKRLDATTGVAKKDPKTKLQELLQMQKLPLPIYTLVDTFGAAHERSFKVACKVSGVGEVVEGVGSNKRSAERDAAEKMLTKITKEKS